MKAPRIYIASDVEDLLRRYAADFPEQVQAAPVDH